MRNVLLLSLRNAASAYRVSKSTLADRYNGKRQARSRAHEHEQNLSAVEEQVLVEWIKAMGRRGLPMTPALIIEYAADVAKKHIGQTWVKRFRKRHPELKVRWTTNLEQCRAAALNPTVVQEFFDLLQELVEEYNIRPENMYNMDEKGIQMGLGKRVAAIVDRDARTVYQVENGNRELVTIIEAVCADGTALHPSVIYQGQRRDLEWARNNPCKASLSYSPKGWTDQELGLKWLQRDFEPVTAARNTSGGYRLLILDGHNSHCTYKFCKFAADHKIIVLCLPSHTTHALQPCDVGVFGPLASCWKAEVNAASTNMIPIDKHNLLVYYHAARQRALKPTTIRSAFTKTGIWPLNPDAIPRSAFEPSLLTTTKAAQPLAVVHPRWLGHLAEEPAASAGEAPTGAAPSPDEQASPPDSSAPGPDARAGLVADSSGAQSRSGDASNGSAVSLHPKLKLVLPAPLPYNASRQQLRIRISELTTMIQNAFQQAEADYAQMTFMENENERLRQLAFHKEKKKQPRRIDTSHARHMTHDEALEELERMEIELIKKELFREAAPIFKAQREKIARYKKTLDAEHAAAERLRKAEERRRERELAELEKERVRQEKARLREETRQEKARLAEEERRKKAEARAEKARQKRDAVVAGPRCKVGRKSVGKGRKLSCVPVEREEPGVGTSRPVPRPRTSRRQADPGIEQVAIAGPGTLDVPSGESFTPQQATIETDVSPPVRRSCRLQST